MFKRGDAVIVTAGGARIFCRYDKLYQAEDGERLNRVIAMKSDYMAEQPILVKDGDLLSAAGVRFYFHRRRLYEVREDSIDLLAECENQDAAERLAAALREGAEVAAA